MFKLLRSLLRRLNYLFYVGSTDILPEPLSKEEEEKYVSLFLKGDTKARDKLIEHKVYIMQNGIDMENVREWHWN